MSFRRFSQNWEKRQVTLSCPSVCPSALNNSVPTGRIFERFGIRGFFENLSTNPSFIKICQDYWVLHMKTCTFIIVSIHPVFLKSEIFQRIFQKKSKHILFSTTFFPKIGDTDGWASRAKEGRSRFWFPMVSLEFFIDTILPAALWPWGRLSF